MTGPPAPPGNRWLPVISLTLLAAAAAALITATQERTQQRIADNEAAEMMKGLAAVLPDGDYDNQPYRDRIMVVDAELLGSNDPQPVYRVRKSGRPVAAVIAVTARNGYVGPIRLLVGISASGTVTGVRVVTHRETPGLGDRIEAKKSNWLSIFAGHSATRPDYDQWLVKRDGGDFDQMTGATVTSRSVVSAVRDAVRYFQEHRDTIFE